MKVKISGYKKGGMRMGTKTVEIETPKESGWAFVNEVRKRAKKAAGYSTANRIEYNSPLTGKKYVYDSHNNPEK